MTATRIDPPLLSVGGLVAMACAMGIGRFIYTPILPSMVEALGLTKGQAGLIASANFVGYLAGALAAVAMPMASPRRWLMAGLVISALTTGMMAWPDSLTAFLVLRFIGGGASALVLVLASTLVLERLNAAGRGDLAAVHFAGVGVGIVLSSLLTWSLATSAHGWRAMWISGGLISMAGTIVAAMLVPSPRDAPTLARSQSAPPVKRGLALLALAYGLFGFGYVITATFIVAIVRASNEIQSTEPLVWLVLGLAAVPSVAAWVAVGRHIGVLPAFAAACVAEAIGVALSVAWQSILGLLLSAALLGGTFMGLTALGLIAAQNLASHRRRAVALMTSAFGVGQIVGPIVAGYGYDLTGSFFGPSMLAAAGLMAGAAAVLMIERERHRHAVL